MAKWRKDGIFVKPLFRMKCQGCRDPKAVFTEVGYALSHFPLDDEHPEKYSAHALDRTYVCNLCGFRAVFGIAISKEHFDGITEWGDKNGAISIVGKSQLN